MRNKYEAPLPQRLTTGEDARVTMIQANLDAWRPLLPQRPRVRNTSRVPHGLAALAAVELFSAACGPSQEVTALQTRVAQLEQGQGTPVPGVEVRSATIVAKPPIATPTISTRSEQAQRGEIFTSASNKFKMTLPQGWQGENRGPQDIVRGKLPSGQNVTLFISSPVIVSQCRSTLRDCASQIINQQEQLAKTRPGNTKPDAYDTKVGAYQALAVSWREQSKIVHQVSLVDNNGNLWILLFDIQPPDRNVILTTPEIRGMLDSFELIGATQTKETPKPAATEVPQPRPPTSKPDSRPTLAPTTTYRSERYGFQVSPPSDWRVAAQYSAGAFENIYNYTAFIKGGSSTQIIIVHSPWGKKTVADIAKQTDQEVKNLEGKGMRVTTLNTNVASYPAVRVSARAQRGSTGFESEFVTILTKDAVFTIMTSQYEKLDQLMPDFNRFVATFGVL